MHALADTHCHLDFHTFDADRERVISRAWEKGLNWIVDPGVDLQTSREALSIAETHPGIYAAVGVHPNDARTWEKDSLAQLEKLARQPGVVAIGEIGLDYYRDRTPQDVQKVVFNDQLRLARALRLPVIIHSRQALTDTLNLLEAWVQQDPPLEFSERKVVGVLHSFDGSLDEARKAIELNFFIGVGGPVTFKNAHQKMDLIKAIPLEYLILETDAPFLTPHPHRGSRNEPAYIPLIAEAIATLHQQPLEKVAEITSQNAARLFGWSL